MPIRERIRMLITVNDSPRRVSLSFAIGVFIGISPFLGLHTLMALAVASMFRLNRLVTLSGAYITNPWTLVPIYTFCTWIGAKLMGYRGLLKGLDFHRINILNIFSTFKNLLLPFFIGTLLVATIAAVITYVVLFKLLTRIKA